MTAKQTTRFTVYTETRRAVLAGSLDNGQALRALTEGGWSEAEAGIAVSSWQTIKTLRVFQGDMGVTRA